MEQGLVGETTLHYFTEAVQNVCGLVTSAGSVIEMTPLQNPTLTQIKCWGDGIVTAIIFLILVGL